MSPNAVSLQTHFAASVTHCRRETSPSPTQLNNTGDGGDTLHHERGSQKTALLLNGGPCFWTFPRRRSLDLDVPATAVPRFGCSRSCSLSLSLSRSLSRAHSLSLSRVCVCPSVCPCLLVCRCGSLDRSLFLTIILSTSFSVAL